ncbi:MAG TPA: hypothetical protein VL492_09555 [Methylovirgula sp.]|nr:hypothetical protein [Methylovirgula sp.]
MNENTLRSAAQTDPLPPRQGAPTLQSRAEAIVNPASGLANDYLNLFNEIVMLIEQLPVMP